MTHITEEWKPVVGFEDYYDVSNTGKVRRRSTTHGILPDRIMRCSLNKQGYCRVTLSVCAKTVERKVHSLVMEAFVGERPAGMVINHLDGVRWNNSLRNLEYVSQKENVRHAYKIGRRHPGEGHPTSKLTNKAVLDIRGRVGSVTQAELAREHEVSTSTVSLVVKRRIWTHL